MQGTTAEIILNSLDILTFVVPPILPAALTANNAFAQRRLEKQGIFCLHSKHISLCGGIDIVAFDKVIINYLIMYIYIMLLLQSLLRTNCDISLIINILVIAEKGRRTWRAAQNQEQ